MASARRRRNDTEPLVLPLTADALTSVERQYKQNELTELAEAALQNLKSVQQAHASRAVPEDATLAALLDAEASANRRAQIAALRRDFEHLSALPASEAARWLARRTEKAAVLVQGAWRSRVARRAFRVSVAQATVARRSRAAVVIQRAHRARRRLAHARSAALQVPQLLAYNAAIGERTAAMVATAQQGAVSQALEAVRKGAGTKLGGSSVVQMLRGAVERGLQRGLEERRRELQEEGQREGKDATEETEGTEGTRSRGRQDRAFAAGTHREVLQWPSLREALQQRAAKQQLLRTRVAAVHAQMLSPQSLPTVENVAHAHAHDAMLTSALAARPNVLAAHRRSLLLAQQAVEATDDASEAGGDSGAYAAGGCSGMYPHAYSSTSGSSHAYPRKRHASAAAIAELKRRLKEDGIDVDVLSPQELQWLARIESGV